MKDLILIGGGGHCTSCIDVIESEGQFKIIGILDFAENVGKTLLNYPIVGTDDDLHQYLSSAHFLVTVGQIASVIARKKIFEKLCAEGAQIATIVSPRANVSKHAKIGRGTIVMHQASINAQVRLGENCIINTGANVEHDCYLEDHIHVSTHAVVNGNCRIGEGSFVGSNATMIQGITLPPYSVVGASAVVVDSFPKPGLFIGSPAKQKEI